jgi:hypothetical protein
MAQQKRCMDEAHAVLSHQRISALNLMESQIPAGETLHIVYAEEAVTRKAVKILFPICVQK